MNACNVLIMNLGVTTFIHSEWIISAEMCNVAHCKNVKHRMQLVCGLYV